MKIELMLDADYFLNLAREMQSQRAKFRMTDRGIDILCWSEEPTSKAQADLINLGLQILKETVEYQ